MEGEAAASKVSLVEIENAAERIRGKAQLTPVLTCSTLDELAGRHLFFKCENFQKVFTLTLLKIQTSCGSLGWFVQVPRSV